MLSDGEESPKSAVLVVSTHVIRMLPWKPRCRIGRDFSLLCVDGTSPAEWSQPPGSYCPPWWRQLPGRRKHLLKSLFILALICCVCGFSFWVYLISSLKKTKRQECILFVTGHEQRNPLPTVKPFLWHLLYSSVFYITNKRHFSAKSLTKEIFTVGMVREMQ